MEHSNWFLPEVQTDRNERQLKMDPRAWLVKVAIVRIELLQKDPTLNERSSQRYHDLFKDWHRLMIFDFSESSTSNGDRLGPAFDMAVVDGFALRTVSWRIEKNDNLDEVFVRAVRSIREAFLRSGFSHRDVSKSFLFELLTSKIHALAGSRPLSKRKDLDPSESDSELAIAHTFFAFLTSVLHLLTTVFQYLIGYVHRGGSKTYSSGAFDFRDTFVALVLFQGAYVWIKFRQAARPDCRKRKAPDVVDIEGCNLKGVYVRAVKEKSSGAITHFKYEPRFTPPRQEGDDGIDLRSKRLPLGEYHTPTEAQIVLQIARHYYAKHEGCVELEDGPCKFPIPPMSEQERQLTGEAKRTWVQRTAKQVGKQMYADFRREKGKHLDTATETEYHGAKFRDPSSDALPLPCSSLPVLTAMLAEPAIASAAPSSPSLPLLSFDGATMGDADDSSEALCGFEDMFAELFCDPGLSNLPEQQSSVVSYQMQYQEFAQLPGDPSLPEVGGVVGSIKHDSMRELNPSPIFQQGRVLADPGTENIGGGIFFPQSVPDLQQMLLCQRRCLEENARQFVDLDHQLNAYQIQNSRLQQEKEQLQQEKEQLRQEKEQLQQEKEQWRQEKEQLRTENASLKSRLEQVAKAQVATWTGIMMDIQQKD